MATRALRTWEDCETEADVTALIAQKSKPDAKGRYHCICCGKFTDPPDPKRNDGEPRCEDHDFSYPGGMNYSEWRDLEAFAEGW
jgi:hypothetical protein